MWNVIWHSPHIFAELSSAPRDVQVRPLSSSTMVIQWNEPEAKNGPVTVSKYLKTCIVFSLQRFIESFRFQGYKVYYTTNPHLAMSRWESQFVDNNKLTTISDLTPHTIYTIRVEAYTAIGPGPPSAPVQVCFQYIWFWLWCDHKRFWHMVSDWLSSYCSYET